MEVGTKLERKSEIWLIKVTQQHNASPTRLMKEKALNRKRKTRQKREEIANKKTKERKNVKEEMETL